jgi:arylsulfatase A-like enzyme
VEGQLPAGQTYDQPVIQLDFHPTALAAAGEARRKFDGVDLLPYLKGEVTARRMRRCIGDLANKWRFATAITSWLKPWAMRSRSFMT